MRRITHYLNIPVNEALWPSLVDSVTFSRMKMNAEIMAPATEIDLWKSTRDFFHSGTNRRWEGILTDKQVSLYHKKAAKQLTASLVEWLEHGRHKNDRLNNASIRCEKISG